jgi:hypothetical protein
MRPAPDSMFHPPEIGHAVGGSYRTDRAARPHAENGGRMSTSDTIAQLHQDITTAEDAGDEAAAARLRQELEKALREAKDPSKTADTE